MSRRGAGCRSCVDISPCSPLPPRPLYPYPLTKGLPSHGESSREADEQEPAPVPFIGEMKNAAQFWADRVTKQFKET